MKRTIIARLLVALAALGSGVEGIRGQAPVTFTAGAANSYFGRSIARGDFNGDGVDDLLVGAPGSLGNDVTGLRPDVALGRAYIFYGPDFTAFTELANPEGTTEDAFGWAVAAGPVGGANAAAYVSAPLAQPASFGRVMSYLTPATDPAPSVTVNNPLPPSAPPTSFGVSLTFAPAVTPAASFLGVGATGFSAGSTDTNGLFWTVGAVSGAVSGGSLSPCIEPNFGAAIAYLPIVPFAGGTYIIGVPFAVRNYAAACIGQSQGRLHHGFPSGGVMGHWYQSDSASMGTSIATGIVGTTGLRTAVGAPFTNEVFVFDRNPPANNPFGGPGLHPVLGTPNTPNILYGEPLQVVNVTGSGYGGRAVALADVNTDGELDLVVGAPGGSDGGRVIVYYGPAPYSDENRADLPLPGLAPGAGFCPDDFLGWSVAVGDYNGDGLPDLAAGRPCDGLSEEGSITVFFGCPEGGFCPPAPPAD